MEASHESAQESVDEARAKLAAATATEARAQAALAAKLRDNRRASAAREMQRDLNRWTRQVEKREKNLADAGKEFAGARNAADEIGRLTGEARNALAFGFTDAETAAVE